MEINDDFIKYFLIKYRKTGKSGVNRIYAELAEDTAPESQFLYEHIVYMVDCGYLKGDKVAYWGITPLGHEFIREQEETKLLDKLGKLFITAIPTLSALLDLVNKING